jgi:hypothetical protein
MIPQLPKTIFCILIIASLLFGNCSSPNPKIVEHNRGFVAYLMRDSKFYIAQPAIEGDFDAAVVDSVFMETWNFYLPFIKYERYEKKIQKRDKKLFQRLAQTDNFRYFAIPYLKETEEAVRFELNVWDMSLDLLVWHSIYSMEPAESPEDFREELSEAVAKTLKSMPVYLNLGRPGE